ncbi:MAG: molybdate ABC transporter substrate-binding protein [Armatimonadetes bacterium]|nr:molybdate ABC transporter substrate-binding protein [Armatimonadota bacterium]
MKRQAMMLLAAFGIGGGLLITLGGCTKGSASANSLFIYVGCGMQPPMDEIARVYEKKTGVQVDYSYAGSACLLAQMKLAERGDAYMPGEYFYMSQAQREGYVVSTDTVAYITPVIIVRKGNPLKIGGLEDLARPGLKIGLGDAQSTAIGVVGEAVLRDSGIYDKVHPNVVMRAGSVAELGNAVKLDALDAALVWDAVASWYPTEADVIHIPKKYNISSSIPFGVLKFSKKQDQARQFVQFVASDEGKQIFQKHGYCLCPPKGLRRDAQVMADVKLTGKHKRDNL